MTFYTQTDDLILCIFTFVGQQKVVPNLSSYKNKVMDFLLNRVTKRVFFSTLITAQHYDILYTA